MLSLLCPQDIRKGYIMSYGNSAGSGSVTVSVYCMTYNQENTIAQTIESIVSQKTDFNFELIIHDDASTDGTADIVRSYAEKYPHIIVPIFQSENQFHNCNLVKTFINPVAKGRFVAVCEGDDYWTDENKLQLQVDVMTNDPECSLCFHAVNQLSSDGDVMDVRPLKKDGHVDPSLVIKRGGLFCPTVSLMFRRNVMDTWPEFRNIADVYDYPAQVLAASMGRVYYIDRFMGVYRFASKGSWTAQQLQKVNVEHLENETRWLGLFNEYTQGRFAHEVDYHLAHMYLTEYRKTFDCRLKKQAKVHIKKLVIRDKLMFNVLFAMFGLLGETGNRLWISLKKNILK